jgi:hypothetical protein
MPVSARKTLTAFCLGLLVASLPGRAAITEADISACLNAPEAREDPALCVAAAHAACRAFPETAPSAAAECFLEARAEWGTLIAAQMETIAAKASERVAQVARIEVKYDLLANLLHCDRMEELAVLGGMEDEHLLRQRAQCEATASGLTYLKLLRRSEGIE